jgi:hypothetical protein
MFGRLIEDLSHALELANHMVINEELLAVQNQHISGDGKRLAARLCVCGGGQEAHQEQRRPAK